MGGFATRFMRKPLRVIALIGLAVGMLAAAAPVQASAERGTPPGQEPVVREVFVDYPKEHPGPDAQAKPSGAPKGGSACTLPATELCTDFKYTGIHWATPTVTYYVNESGASGSLGAIQTAFGTWDNETGSPAVEAAYPGNLSAIDYTYAAPTDAKGPVFDTKNVVFFDDLSSYCSNCLAATWYWYNRYDKHLVEFDIGFNTNYSWSVSVAGETGKYDVQNVATHEVGHTLVLSDLYVAKDGALTMYGYAGVGETNKWDLGAGDVLGVRKIYPL
ncbi:MAG: matrixin family metalloprotease [Actinomycetota bacterium]